MTREDPPLRIRLPVELKKQIQELAAKSRRSMNSEIVSRLEASIALGVETDETGFTVPVPYGAESKTVEQRLAALEEKMNKIAGS